MFEYVIFRCMYIYNACRPEVLPMQIFVRPINTSLWSRHHRVDTLHTNLHISTVAVVCCCMLKRVPDVSTLNRLMLHPLIMFSYNFIIRNPLMHVNGFVLYLCFCGKQLDTGMLIFNFMFNSMLTCCSLTNPVHSCDGCTLDKLTDIKDPWSFWNALLNVVTLATGMLISDVMFSCAHHTHTTQI